MTQSELPALHGVRILDLTTPRAELAGRMLAELGAEVLKLEPPGGSEARRLPPFDESDGAVRGASLYWATVGMGKHSAVVDITTADGQQTVRELARRAGVGYVTIVRIENRHMSPTVAMLEKLAKALKVHVTELFPAPRPRRPRPTRGQRR